MLFAVPYTLLQFLKSDRFKYLHFISKIETYYLYTDRTKNLACTFNTCSTLPEGRWELVRVPNGFVAVDRVAR